MKIAIVTDYVIGPSPGGAALVNHYIYQKLAESEFIPEYVIVNSSVDQWDRLSNENYSLIILTNLPFVSSQRLYQITGGKVPYISFRHDIVGAAYVNNPRTHPVAALLANLFKYSQLNIFISSIQVEYYKKLCNIDSYIILPPPINLDSFSPTNEEKSLNFLYLGDISPERGLDDSISYINETHPGHLIDFYGNLVDKSLAKRILELGHNIYNPIQHSKVPIIMNKYSRMIYHPRIIDAFSLKVVEAELCNLEVHTNKARIGRYYFDADAIQLKYAMKSTSINSIISTIFEIVR